MNCGRAITSNISKAQLLWTRFFRHRMHVPVKWTAIAQVEKARLVTTAQRMRRFGRQTDECLAGEILLAAIAGDVGEGSLEPYVSLVTAVTVIGDREVRRNPQQQFRRAGGELAAEERDLRARSEAFELQRCPFQVACISNRLLRPECRKPFSCTVLSRSNFNRYD